MRKVTTLMLICFMATLMMMTVGCQKDSIVLDGTLPGLFSVSKKKQVHFSKGNIQYQASTNTWRFADHQYDYVGTQISDGLGHYGGTVNESDNRNISSTYSGWIDLFGWGTGNNPTLASTTVADYYGKFVDWGGNAISSTGHQWRTLTYAEWDYLLNTRTDASDKYGIGNINGVGGLIILPDSWAKPSGCSFKAGVSLSPNDWSHNSYTLAKWAKMEAAGAVFLPAAGEREGTDVRGVGEKGRYWSSTRAYEYAAKGMGFQQRSIFVDCKTCGTSLRLGYSVRLVLDN